MASQRHRNSKECSSPHDSNNHAIATIPGKLCTATWDRISGCGSGVAFLARCRLIRHFHRDCLPRPYPVSSATAPSPQITRYPIQNSTSPLQPPGQGLQQPGFTATCRMIKALLLSESDLPQRPGNYSFSEAWSLPQNNRGKLLICGCVMPYFLKCVVVATLMMRLFGDKSKVCAVFPSAAS